MAPSGDQSEPVNPYEASAVVDPRSHIAEAVVGVWRDGDLMVLHCDARLPPICVRCAHPATNRITQRLVWDVRSFSMQYRVLNLQLPLCARCFFRGTRLSQLFKILALLALGAMIGLELSLDNVPVGLAAPLALGFIAAAAGFLVAAVVFRTRVRLCRFYGDYLWLSGAGPPYLAQLSSWPHGA